MLETLEEYEVLTAREMAELLDLAQNTVAMRFKRARRGQALVQRNRKTGRHWLTHAGAARLAWYRAHDTDTTD